MHDKLHKPTALPFSATPHPKSNFTHLTNKHLLSGCSIMCDFYEQEFTVIANAIICARQPSEDDSRIIVSFYFNTNETNQHKQNMH